MPTTSRVSAGLRFSKVSPVEDSTHSPSMKFLNTLVGWLLPRVAGEAMVSVAIIAPYKCLNIDATGVREGAAREDRLQGGWVATRNPSGISYSESRDGARVADALGIFPDCV